MAALSFRQQDPLPERGLRWAQRLEVALGHGSAAEMRDVALRARAGNHCGGTAQAARQYDYILPTGGGIGYGDFVLDSRTRTYLIAHLARHSGCR